MARKDFPWRRGGCDERMCHQPYAKTPSRDRTFAARPHLFPFPGTRAQGFKRHAPLPRSRRSGVRPGELVGPWRRATVLTSLPASHLVSAGDPRGSPRKRRQVSAEASFHGPVNGDGIRVETPWRGRCAGEVMPFTRGDGMSRLHKLIWERLFPNCDERKHEGPFEGFVILETPCPPHSRLRALAEHAFALAGESSLPTDAAPCHKVQDAVTPVTPVTPQHQAPD